MGAKLLKSTKLKSTWTLHLMLFLPVVLLVIFCYTPMVGIVVAFQDYLPTKGFFGSKWVGLQYFNFLFSIKDTWNVIRNTLVISVGKIVVGLSVSVVFAILLNEININSLKKSIQTFVFFPYFLSWVILGSILVDILSLDGAFNSLIKALGMKPVMFLANNTTFVPVIVLSNTWKDFGYNMIIFYAAIMNIDPTLYEAATVDGAGRLRQTWNITLPSMAPIVAVVGLLSLGGVLNAGFDQIFNMYNPLVMRTGDILDTYIYRLGLMSGQYAFATAAGLLKSLVGFVLIIIAYRAADRFANYRIL